MKIIDEKGKLFGKINVIDFLVIFFLLSLVPMFYFGYKIMTKKSVVEESVPEVLKREFIEIEINCQFIKLEFEVAENISVGDKALDENGQVIGEVVSLGKITPYVRELNMASDKKLIKNDLILKQIPVTLKIKAEVRQNNLYYKNKQILKDLPIDFITDRYNVEAVVLPLPTLWDRIGALEGSIGALEGRVKNSIGALEGSIGALENKVDAIFSSPKIKKLIRKK